MKIECHILQNFPPHCLNRDDTNSPKDCEFGGVRRARISSQCFKRAVRDAFEQHQSFSPELRAVRTKRVVEQTVERLLKKGRPQDQAINAVVQLLAAVDLKVEGDAGNDSKTQYLLFLPERKLDQLAAIADEHWEALTTATAPAETTPEPAKGKGKGKKGGKPENTLPKETKAAVEALLKDAQETPEIALFGRMIANSPDWNVEAACQVAQALSTHRVSMEFDFFTAVDDLKGDDTAGSDMMGTVQFNSACFYRYAVLDTDALQENLGGPQQAALCKSSVEAFLKAFVHALPTGKQNSMAAHTLPSLVLFTVREKGQPVSLANAFVKPIDPRGGSLEAQSQEALARHFEKLVRMYPSDVQGYAASLESVNWGDAPVTSSSSVDELVAAVSAKLSSGGSA